MECDGVFNVNDESRVTLDVELGKVVEEEEVKESEGKIEGRVGIEVGSP